MAPLIHASPLPDPAVQPGEPLDARVLAPVDLPDRARALATAVRRPGGVLVEGRTARRGTRYWAATLRVVDGAALGAYAELRLWPDASPAYLGRRLGELVGAAPDDVLAWTDEERRAGLERALATRSHHVRLEVAGDGRLEVAFVDGSAARVEPGPGLPAPATVRRVPPLPHAAAPAIDPAAVPYDVVGDRAGVLAVADAVRAASLVALDIETDCGPLGSPAEWEPCDGAIRLVQVAWRDGDGSARCAVVDGARVAPDPLVRALAAPGRTIVAHNIRYEQRWLAFHHGIGAFAHPFDTSCAFRVLERHWAVQDPRYEPLDATLGTVMRRVLGLGKAPFGTEWWGAEDLPRPQLDYAALDAVALLLLHDRVVEVADGLGVTVQVRAASRSACREALRRLPGPRPAAFEAVAGLIDAAGDVAALERAAAVARRVSLGHVDRTALRAAWRARREALVAGR